jgi:multidrug efflux pump subunit AcrA (membrane-fusion protein)
MKMLLSRWLFPLLVACSALAGCDQPQAASFGAPPDPEVVVSRPVVRQETEYEDFTGLTQAVHMIEVRARVSGYLARVCFVEGAEVKQGDLLFEIDPRPYKAELERARANAAQAEAHRDRIKNDYARAKSLVETRALAREDYDKVVGDLAEAEAALGVARAQLETAELNERFTRVRAEISGRISRRLIDPWNMVKADETPLTTIVSLDPIYAYFDVDEANALRLVRLGKIKLLQERPGTSAAVPAGAAGGQGAGDLWPGGRRGRETRAERESHTERGDTRGESEGTGAAAASSPRTFDQSPDLIEVLLGLGDEEGFPHPGRVDFIDNQIDANTGTLRMRAIVPNPQRLLSPGLFVRVRLPLGAPHSALLVSEQALVRDQAQKKVYVVNDQNKVEYRGVTVGRLYDGLREITRGIKPGDRVVVSGLQRIPREGVTVVAKEEKMPEPVRSQ